MIGHPYILIVEDDVSIRETLQLALEYEGYLVQTASNGQEGIELLSHNSRPSLILLDLMMPVMDGWQFAEILSQDIELATIPIFVVTAFAEKAQNIKSRGILKKPVDLDSLFRIAKEYCGALSP